MLLSIDVVRSHVVLSKEVLRVHFLLSRREPLSERSERHDGETEGAWLPFDGENLVQRKPLHHRHTTIGV